MKNPPLLTNEQIISFTSEELVEYFAGILTPPEKKESEPLIICPISTKIEVKDLRICTKCKIEKPITAFYKSNRATGVRNYQCIQCRKESYNSKSATYSRIRRNYKLSKVDYEFLIKKRRGKCSLCKKKVSKLNIDHDHQTDIVRDLICSDCNFFIGFLEKRAHLLKKAIRYLKFNRENPAWYRQEVES